jgi:SAM-dependent methyltransferase
MKTGNVELRELLRFYTKEYFEGMEDLINFRVEKTVSFLGDIKGERVLDVGCGTGKASKILRSVGAEVISLDIMMYAVRVCHEAGFDVMRGSAHELPFRECCFNGILLLDVIEHIPRSLLLNALREFYRVLIFSGKLAIHTMPNLFLEKLSILYGIINRRHWRRSGIQGGHVNTYTCWRLKDDLEYSGLKITFFEITPYPKRAPFSFVVSPISKRIKWLLGPDFWVCCEKITK